MLFNSITFLWLFLPILLVLYFSIGKIFPKTKNYILLVFSLVFYAWGEPKYVLLMIASIVVNYIFGLLIDRARRKRKKKQKTLWLVLDIIFNIGLLGHFKYFNFLVANVNNVFGANTLTIGEIALPIGISFYTFQVMSYVIDLYRGEIKVQKNLSKLALYVSFFPQLIAGPIVKYHDIDEALSSRKETTEKFAYGVKRFSYGLAKKVLIADAMAAIVDAIFVTGSGVQGLTQPVAWLGALCYALQIFFDFSGYSDMAIGLGSMFGFKFMENFNLPYISGSITEFWRRWHISLSTWFKEYIYIPNRNETSNINGNTITVKDFNINLTGTLKLDGGNNSKNIDVNALLNDYHFINNLKELIKTSINNDMNGGRFMNDLATMRGHASSSSIIGR